MKHLIPVLLATAGALSSPAHAQSALPSAAFVAAGKWSVDYADDACVLSREFAAGGVTLKFSYQPWVAFSGAKITVASSGERPPSGKATITFLPAGQAFVLASAEVPGASRTPELTFGAQDAGFADAFAHADAAEITFKRNYSLRLALSPTQPATAALRTCEDDRLRSYGLDPARVVAIPPGKVVAAFSPYDYPVEAIRAGAQGAAIVALAFDRAGAPTLCKVVKGSGNQALDRASCASAASGIRLERAPDGIETRWTVFPVRWVLPSTGRSRRPAPQSSGR